MCQASGEVSGEVSDEVSELMFWARDALAKILFFIQLFF